MRGKINKTLDIYMTRLTTLLDSKKKGDILYDSEIYNVAGVSAARLYGRIRKHFWTKGIIATHRPDPVNGFKLLDNKNQLDHGADQIRRGIKVITKSDKIINTVDTTKLDDVEKTKHLHLSELTYRLSKTTAGWLAETRFILGGSKKAKQLNKAKFINIANQATQSDDTV